MLSELLSTERVRVPLGSHSKADLLRELVTLALRDRDVSEETMGGVLAAVVMREATMSTAMGGGLAVPHGRTDLVPEVYLAAGLAEGVSDYASPDSAPVRAIFLVLTPVEASGAHVKVLARIARILHHADSREALFRSRSAEEFVGVIRRSEGIRQAQAS